MINKFNPEKVKNLRVINQMLRVVFHEKKSTQKPDITKADNILIIDPTLIGDIVMLIPALRILRKNNENCKITLACAKWAKNVLEDQNLVDEFIFVDPDFINSVKKLAINRKELKEHLKRINVREYDYAIEPRGDLRYIFFMHYCNAKRKISYNYTGGECFLTDVIKPSDDVTHLVEDKLYFISSLGCDYDKLTDVYPRLVLSEQQRNKRELFIKENSLEGKTIIGIHPGASLDKKQWDGFSRLPGLLSDYNKDIVYVIFKGPKEDKAVASVEEAAKANNANYIISETSLNDYLIRISACSVMICNDSGAGHLAAAYGVTPFVIFGPFYPELVKPYSKENAYCFSETIDCKPCMSKTCERNKECLELITADKVAESIKNYFKENRSEEQKK